MNSDLYNPEIQVGDFVEIILPNINSIGVFEIIDIISQPNVIDVYLTSPEDDYNNRDVILTSPEDDYNNRDVILTLTLDNNIIYGLPSQLDLNSEELLVTFIKLDNYDKFDENLLDGLEVDDEDKLEEAKNKLRNFWTQDNNELDLSELEIKKLPRKYFEDSKIINNLKILDLDNNKLRSLLEEPRHGREPLTFAKRMGLEIGNLHNLQYLDLSENLLTSLPEEPWDCVAVLRTLDIRKANGIGNRESTNS